MAAALVLFCLLGAAQTPAPDRDVPRLECRPGVTVERKQESTGHRVLTRQTERDEKGEREVPAADWTFDMTGKQVLLDEYRACADGRVTTLARTFVELERGRTQTMRTAQGVEKGESPETSLLKGRRVVFTRKPGETAWGRALEGGPDHALTAPLVAEASYAELLPPAGVRPGGKWELDFAVAKHPLLRPDGDLPFEPKKPPTPMDWRLRSAVWDATAGKLALELGNVVEIGGRRTNSIRFKGTMTFDATVARQKDEQGPLDMRLEVLHAVEGTLVWDLDAGRARSLEWTARGTLKHTVHNDPSPPGTPKPTPLEQVRFFDESYTYKAALAAR